jgi:hypothetical protein
MQSPKTSKLITAAAYARLRGLAKSTISRQIRRGQIPVSAEGLLDPVAADRARERNLDQSKRLGAELRKRSLPPRGNRKADAAAAPPAAGVDEPDLTHQARVDVLAEIAAPSEVLLFALACVHLGCSRELACAMAQLYSAWPALALDDVSPEDLEGIAEPSPDEWRRALGRFDMQAADQLCDSALTNRGDMAGVE